MSAPAQQWPWQRLNESNAPAHELLASLLETASGERWLDVGTGAGGLAFALARRGADVVGVDISEEGLEHARRQASEDGLAVDFRHGSPPPAPWEEAVRSIGFLRELVERLGADDVAALRAELERIDESFSDRKPTYVVVLGRRR